VPDSETFDAFYARTVWNVTSQMHELAGDDGLADHAIREAYAKAYQQWYQVSGYRDSEGWVLATATDAYERRRAEAGAEGHVAAAQAPDPGTWPGIYRPRPDAGSHRAGPHQPPADPEATMAAQGDEGVGRGAPAPGGHGPGAAYPGVIPTEQTADYPAASAMAMGARTADGIAAGTGTSAAGVAEPAGLAGGGVPTQPAGRPGGSGLGRPGSRRTALIAGAAIAALLIAGITYLAAGGHKPKATAASQGTSPKVAAKPKPHMLPAGQTGRRSAVPWSLVGPGWAVAEYSTAQPNSAGNATAGGKYSTYLVDPEGGKYQITTSSGGAEPQLMAWSGNAKEALFGSGGTSTAAGTSSYSLLKLRSGRLTALQLPAGVAAVGFTRPDGLAILAVQQGPAQFHLQRYTLNGQLEPDASSLASLPRKQGLSWPSNGCSSACALSSPQGVFDVWGIAGDEMEVLNNDGGKPTKVRLPGSGHRSSCVPLAWWNDSTILADCATAGLPDDGAQPWLVPASGSQPTPLIAASGSPAGNGDIEGAWQAGATTYVTSTTFTQCQNAPSGPGGVDILRLGQGSNTTVTIPGSTNNVNRIVGSSGNRLLVLAQTSCPGTSSLLWFDPSTSARQTVLTAPETEVGVIAAVPFGNGPTAVTNGQG
jgi:hypothetical protein